MINEPEKEALHDIEDGHRTKIEAYKRLKKAIRSGRKKERMKRKIERDI